MTIVVQEVVEVQLKLVEEVRMDIIVSEAPPAAKPEPDTGLIQAVPAASFTAQDLPTWFLDKVKDKRTIPGWEPS